MAYSNYLVKIAVATDVWISGGVDELVHFCIHCSLLKFNHPSQDKNDYLSFGRSK